MYIRPYRAHSLGFVLLIWLSLLRDILHIFPCLSVWQERMAVSSSHGLHYCGSVRIVSTLASLIRAKSYWTLDSSSQISAQMTKHSLDNRIWNPVEASRWQNLCWKPGYDCSGWYSKSDSKAIEGHAPFADPFRSCSNMLLLISQEIFLCAILCSCWPILRRLVFKTSLDNVPGLPSHSFWMGNILEVFNINGWEFHKELQQKCMLSITHHDVGKETHPSAFRRWGSSYRRLPRWEVTLCFGSEGLASHHNQGATYLWTSQFDPCDELSLVMAFCWCLVGRW